MATWTSKLTQVNRFLHQSRSPESSLLRKSTSRRLGNSAALPTVRGSSALAQTSPKEYLILLCLSITHCAYISETKPDQGLNCNVEGQGEPMAAVLLSPATALSDSVSLSD